jgi:O-antigen/teichoic acid export membrane protein
MLAPLEKNLEFFQLALIRNSCAIFGTILAVLTALASPSIWSLVLREVIVGLSMLIIGFHCCAYQLKINLNKIKSQNLRLFRYGYSVALTSASEIFFYKIPELIVANLLGAFATGQLNQSKSFLMITLKVPNTFLEQILFSSLVGLSKSKKSHEYFRFVEILTSRLMMIAAWLVLLVGPQIFIELFGSKWKLAASLLPYLAGFVFFAAIFNAAQAYLYSLQRQLYVTFAYLIGIVSFIIVLTSANGPITLELTGLAITFSMASATFALYASGRLIGIPLSFSKVFIIPLLSVIAFWLLELPTTIGDYQTLIFTLSMICISAFEVALAIKRVKIILA